MIRQGSVAKRRRLPLPLFVVIGLEATAFIALGIAAEPWALVSLTDIPVTLGAVAVALLVMFSVTWRATRRELREARAAEELVSLEDLHHRIHLYAPKHASVEAPRRDVISHFLHDAGIHTSEQSAAWAASFREKVGIAGAESKVAAQAAAQVTSDPDEDIARWRDAAVALVAQAPAEPPPPATLELGWKVPAITSIPDPISRVPEPVWAVAASHIRAVMAEARSEVEEAPEPATTYFELPAPAVTAEAEGPAEAEIVLQPDVAMTEVVEAHEVVAVPEMVAAPEIVTEPGATWAEPIVEQEAAAESLAEPVAAVSEEAPELKALVRALDALRTVTAPDEVARIPATPSAGVSSFPDGWATASLNPPSSKPSSSSANADATGPTAGRRGPVRRRRAFRRRAAAGANGAGEIERSITVVAPSRPRDGAEVRLRLDLDSDGLAALLHALEQAGGLREVAQVDEMPVQPGLVVIPGGKPAQRAN